MVCNVKFEDELETVDSCRRWRNKRCDGGRTFTLAYRTVLSL